VIPFFRVEFNDLKIIISEFIHLAEIIHLGQDEMKIDQHFIVGRIIPQVSELTRYFL
jgi:hypothetical protein